MPGRHRVAVVGLGLSALIASAFLMPSRPAPALARVLDDDDDDDDKPRRGPRLAPGHSLGLALTFSRGDVRDARPARLVALDVPAGSPPSAFLAPGPFRATWEGDLAIPIRGDYSFHPSGRGTIKVELNGKSILEGSGEDLSKLEGPPAKLRKGTNKLVVTYDSPESGDAVVRLSWSSEDFPREPLPPTEISRESALESVATGSRLREGRELVADLRCLKCHAPDSPITGPGAMPELATDAPNLQDAGGRLRADWMARWIEDPKALRPSATMPKMPIGSKDAGDIAAYLATLGAEGPADAHEPEAEPEAVAAGGRLFANLGCVGCHTRPDRDDRAGDANKRVPLRLVGSKWKGKALVAFLRQPDRHYAWIKMPNFHLSAEEAEGLAAYVSAPPRVDLKSAGPGDPTRGKALFASAGCVSCHALPGVADGPKAPGFASIGDGPKGCLAPADAPGRKAPDFGLSEGQLAAIRAFAKVGLGSMARDPAPEFAERQVKALNCAACHRRDGYDDAWTDLKSEVDDLLVGAPAEEKDPDGLPYPAAQERPPLTWIGEKLKPEWAAAFIAGKLDYKPRPYLRARMPAFPIRAEGLAVGLALEHGYAAESPADPPWDPSLIPVARQLVKNNGLNCVSCHNVGKTPAVGVFEAPGINFMRVKERLRKDYYERWVRAPIRVDPLTKMPTYFTGENSVLPTVLDGKADKQIGALWNYLLQGTEIEPPGN